jgi:hypothetical protein
LRHAVREALGPAAGALAMSFLPGPPEIGDEATGDDWGWVDATPPQEPRGGEKSIMRAVVASAILPGLGERYGGANNRAKLFLLTETVIWTVFTYHRLQGDARRDRQEEFALFKGGAPRGGDDDYYEHIGFWLSLEEWHDIVRRDARLRFPDDPAAREEFFEKNKRYDEGQAWTWPDDEVRTRYRQLRSQTERSYRNARLALGAALFNRLASMVNALYVVRSHNRRIRAEARLDLRLEPRRTVNGPHPATYRSDTTRVRAPAGARPVGVSTISRRPFMNSPG